MEQVSVISVQVVEELVLKMYLRCGKVAITALDMGEHKMSKCKHENCNELAIVAYFPGERIYLEYCKLHWYEDKRMKIRVLDRWS